MYPLVVNEEIIYEEHDVVAREDSQSRPSIKPENLAPVHMAIAFPIMDERTADQESCQDKENIHFIKKEKMREWFQFGAM